MSLLKKLKITLGMASLITTLNLEDRLYSKDIYVPRDYSTIQSAIDASENGDRILVADGEYMINESITYHGKDIILESVGRAEKTVINGSGKIRVFTFDSGEDNNCILDGFTITNGEVYPSGGGIYCKDSSPTIKNNIIIRNRAVHGGGIACFNANPLIINNKILKNTGSASGGGIYFDDHSNLIIQENIISENSVEDGCGGGIYSDGDSLGVIQNNIIISNYAREIGGGIYSEDGSKISIQNNIIANNKTIENGGGIGAIYSVVDIFNNTIVNNSTEYMGGGIHFVHEDNPSYNGFMLALNNIIWGNKGESEIYARGPFLIAYNNISKSEFCGQKGNICADPLFIDAENNDYRLQADSPCIDAGHPADDDADPDSTVADLGAVYFDQKKNKFIRGDANRDSSLDISDAITNLFYLFGNKKLECKNAADSNDDGRIDLADPIYLLDFLFKDGRPPLAPFPEQGYDFTHDKLGCYVPPWPNLETLLDGG